MPHGPTSSGTQHILTINYGTTAGTKDFYVRCRDARNNEGNANTQFIYDTSASNTIDFIYPCDINAQNLQNSCIDTSNPPTISVRMIANDPNTGIEDIKYKLCTYEDPDADGATPCSPTNEIQTGTQENDFWTELNIPSDQWVSKDETLDYTFIVDWDGDPDNDIQDPPIGEYLKKVSTMNGAGEWDEKTDPIGVAITKEAEPPKEESSIINIIRGFIRNVLSFFGF